MVSNASSVVASSPKSNMASFELVSRSSPIVAEDPLINGADSWSKNKDTIKTLDELKATIYPPNPKYDIAEKPWLPGPQKPYLLLKANLVDPRAGVVHKNMTLQLAGGKIVRVGPTTDAEVNREFCCAGQKVEKIDASKYFVCPGLIDCQYNTTSPLFNPTWSLCN